MLRTSTIWALAFLIAAVLLPGCAVIGGHPVVTHANAKDALTPGTKVTVAHRDDGGPMEQSLERELTDALSRAGLEVVSQAQADYVMTFQVEDNVNRGSAPSPAWTVGANGTLMTSPTPYPYSEFRTPTAYYSQGLRLKLLEARKNGRSGLDTAWEGYIEAGEELHPEKIPALVRTLMVHLGRDFNGKVTLQK